jgi:hypothetical protein
VILPKAPTARLLTRAAAAGVSERQAIDFINKKDVYNDMG